MLQQPSQQLSLARRWQGAVQQTERVQCVRRGRSRLAVKRLEIGDFGDFGGSSHEHPRRWLGAQWLVLVVLALGVPSRRARPEEAQGANPSLGGAHCQGGQRHFDRSATCRNT